MTRLMALLPVATLLTAVGCSDKTAGGGGCRTNAACGAGMICDRGVCRSICRSDPDCADDEICSGAVCVPGARDDAPQISAVDGDDAALCAGGAGTHCVRTGLLVRGARLAGAEFRLQPAQNSLAARVLGIRDGATDTEVALDLPADLDFPNIEAGRFTLTAVNGVGADQAPLTFLQGVPGEDFTPTGDELVASLNTATVNRVDSARLHVGTGATDVAAGNHDHAAQYVPSAGGTVTGSLAVNAALTAGTLTAGTITGADFVRSAPVERWIWLDGAAASPGKATDAGSYELYRRITDAARIIFNVSDADSALTPTGYATANHGEMGLFSENGRDITFSIPIVLNAGDVITRMDCYMLDQRTNGRVQVWLEKQELTSTNLPTLLGNTVVHSGLIDSATNWQVKSLAAINETVGLDHLYRLRGELNVNADGDSEFIGFRGCRLFYTTTRP